MQKLSLSLSPTLRFIKNVRLTSNIGLLVVITIFPMHLIVILLFCYLSAANLYHLNAGV